MACVDHHLHHGLGGDDLFELDLVLGRCAPFRVVVTEGDPILEHDRGRDLELKLRGLCFTTEVQNLQEPLQLRRHHYKVSYLKEY